MTTKERAAHATKKLIDSINLIGDMDRRDIGVAFEQAIDAAVKDATEGHAAELQSKVDNANFWSKQFDEVSKQLDAIRAIARELAAKHIRGKNACTCCGAVGYMGGMEHNAGCAVKRLEEFR